MATFSRRRATRSLFALPIIAGLAFSMTACSAPERPTAEELATGLAQIWDEQGIGDQISPETNLCIAQVMIDSDVSDTTLANAAKGKDLGKKGDEAKLMEAMQTPEAEACITAAQ